MSNLFTELHCHDPYARMLEEQMQLNICAFEFVQDDKVVPRELKIPVEVTCDFFGVHQEKTFAGEGLGYHIEPVLEDLSEDLPKLSPSVFNYNRETVEHLETIAKEWLGDILPCRRINATNQWHAGLTMHLCDLMGMENMFVAMYDTPDEFHQVMQFLVDDIIRLYRWEEANGLMYANAGNDYMGSGSYCFNRELAQSGTCVSTETWGHMNSQESVGVSPDQYGEFIFPYYAQLAKQFGLLYYGCCEPVEPLWDDYLSKLPNLRKVSISPWCNEEAMSERLRNCPVIYSRKPNPNLIGVNPELDEDALRSALAKSFRLGRDCHMEMIFRDVYTLHNNPCKARRVIEIAHSLI